MKKGFLSLLLVAFLAVGCGGGSGSGADDVERLSKTEYQTKMGEVGNEMTTLATKFSSGEITDMNAYIDEANKLIDEMINYNGPKDLEDKEKAIDDALAEFKTLMESLKDVAKGDVSKLSEFSTKYADVFSKLSESLNAYK